MINFDNPLTYENSENPWLMDPKDISEIIEIDGQKYTGQYLWSLNSEQRIEALNKVYKYYREKGFPYETLKEGELEKEFQKLKKYNSQAVVTNDGFISNSGTLGLKICRVFNNDYFYKAYGAGKDVSLEDAFDDDELFIKVLKNRMGWNTSKEGGIERPYLFGISDTQIRNGIKNSGIGYAISNFRPVVAKFCYDEAYRLYKEQTKAIPNKISVYDYSGGWGARCLGALSLGFDYTCVDPLTSENIALIAKSLNININSYRACSEEFKLDKEFDIIGSCPPYFDLEIYSKDKTQCTSETNYKNWLEYYWKNTVKNCYQMLKKNGIFFLVMKETHKKYELLQDMKDICISEGLIEIKDYQYKTTTNHLSGKSKSGKVNKTNEHIVFFAKK
jgi:hypothetical protein